MEDYSLALTREELEVVHESLNLVMGKADHMRIVISVLDKIKAELREDEDAETD